MVKRRNKFKGQVIKTKEKKTNVGNNLGGWPEKVWRRIYNTNLNDRQSGKECNHIWGISLIVERKGEDKIKNIIEKNNDRKEGCEIWKQC